MTNELTLCKRCGKQTDVLAVFPGGVCLDCWAAKEGSEPLSQRGFDGMVNIGDKVKAIAYTDCFGKEHAEIRGLVVLSAKHIPAQHGVAAYDRLDCELENLGEALANRHKLPEIIRVEAAARFFAHEDAHVPPTCLCGSVLSAVTFTCVRGKDCTARYQLHPFTLSAREYSALHEDRIELSHGRFIELPLAPEPVD